MNSKSKTVSTPSRRERERLRKEADLRQAAERVFAQKGFHEASMEEIAKAAEYATGTLYHYFPSKEALYLSVLEDKLRAMNAFVQERLSKVNDPAKQLEQVVRARIEFGEQNRSFLSIHFRESLETRKQDSERWQALRELHEQRIQRDAEAIAAGQAAGIFRAGPPRLYAVILEGILYGLMRDWLLQDHKVPLNGVTDFILQICLHGILHPSSPFTPSTP